MVLKNYIEYVRETTRDRNIYLLEWGDKSWGMDRWKEDKVV